MVKKTDKTKNRRIMKPLLFILLLIPLLGLGQETPRMWTDLHKYRMMLDSVMTPRLDTIPVVMLVSDTTHVKCLKTIETIEIIKKTNSVWKWNSIKEVDVPMNEVQTIRGYSVRKVIRVQGSIINGAFCLDCPDSYKHLYYLGADKKPLKETVIVWDFKPVKSP